MVKKIFLGLLFLISITAYSQTNYYVKNGGSDEADGTSDATAWATIDKVNNTISSGDTVLFARGSVWREQIDPVNGTVDNYTYYGAYGVGDKPLFLGSETKNEGSDWSDLGGNIWTTANSSFLIDVGNIIFNNEASFGVKIMDSTPTLDEQGEYWYDFTNDLIHLYSVGNPATVYTNIECAKTWSAVQRSTFSYCIFQNLEWKYWGECGVYMTNGSNENKFLDIDMSYIGGGDMLSDYTTRFGNGITCYRGTSNITIKRCKIDNVYDAGISPQGNSSTYTIENWIMQSNIITNCQYSYEYFAGVGSTVNNIYFENNTCLYAGYEWSSDQRPDNSHARHVRFGINNGSSTNIFIRNNIFYESTDRIYSINDTDDATDFVINHNVVYTSGPYIGYIGGNYYTTWDDWLTNIYCSPDIYSINSDPVFVSGSDYHLQSTSPAINAGIDVGLTTDYAGTAVPQGIYFDIGAYEFEAFPVATTGLGWENHYAKKNFKDDVNFEKGFSVEGVPINFTTNVTYLLRLSPTASPPVSPTEGTIYMDTDHHLYLYNGSAWVQLDN